MAAEVTEIATSIHADLPEGHYLAGYELAVKASDNYRSLRATGITIRKTIETLIATRCIEDGLTLLHADRDFLPFAQHLGLKVAFSET